MEAKDGIQFNRQVYRVAKIAKRRRKGIVRRIASHVNLFNIDTFRRINARKSASQGGSPCRRGRYIKGISRAYKGARAQGGTSRTTNGIRAQGARTPRSRE